MEMHQVRYFLSVARTLNFTHAADECHVAQPSLSRAIRKLEEELGGDLFRRERGLSHLTELGRSVLPLLTQCHEHAMAARNLAASLMKSGNVPLRLALSHTINIQLLVQPLTALVRTFPGLEVNFSRGTAQEVGELLKAGAAELGIACPLPDPWERLEGWPLFSEGFRLAANEKHPLAAKPRVALEDVAQARFLARAYCEQGSMLQDAMQTRGIARQFSDTVATDYDLLTLIEANVGVSVVPESTLAASALRGIAIDGIDFERAVVLYGVAGRQRTPAATTLVKLLRAADWSRIISQTRRRAAPGGCAPWSGHDQSAGGPPAAAASGA